MTKSDYNVGLCSDEYSTTSKSIVLKINRASLTDSAGRNPNRFDFIKKWKAYKIRLREGISAPFEAKVSVILTEKINSDDLKQLLEKPVSIFLERESHLYYLHSKTRCLTGIFSSYVFDGVVATSDQSGGGKGKNVLEYYSYTFTIVSRLHLLSLNKRTRSYITRQENSNTTIEDKTDSSTGKTGYRYKNDSLVEVIKKIFAPYDGNLNAVINIPTEYNLGDIIYQQVDESDLSFLNRLCVLHGINYNTFYDAQKFKEKVVFSCDTSFVIKNDASSASSSNSLSDISILDYVKGSKSVIDCEMDYLKKKNYRDRYTISKAYFEENVAPSEIKLNESIEDSTGYKKYGLEVLKNLFLNSREVNSKFTDFENNIIKKSYEGLIGNNSNRFIAKTSDFVFVPGSIVKIPKFMDNNDGEYFITRTELKFKLKIKGIYIDRTESSDETPIEQNILGIKWTRDMNLGSFSTFPMFDELSTSSFAQTDPFDVIANKYAIKSKAVTNEVLSNNQNQFFIGTVCDKNGRTALYDNSQLYNEYELSRSSLFHVKLSNQVNPIVAQFVSPNSSSIGFASNLPKVGQKVLVLCVDGIYLIQGVLPHDDGVAKRLDGYEDQLQRSELNIYETKSLKETTSDNGTKSFEYENRSIGNRYVNNNLLGRASFDQLTSYFKFLIMQNMIDSYMKHVSLDLKNDKLYEKYLYLDLSDSNEERSKPRKFNKEIRQLVKDIVSKTNKLGGIKDQKSEEYKELAELHKKLNDKAEKIKDLIENTKDDKNKEIGKAYLNDLVATCVNNTSAPGETKEVTLSGLVSQDLGPLVIDSNNGSINIHSGKKINITSDDTICIKAAKGVRIIDDKSIELKVDNSTQSITNEKIVLTQGGYEEASKAKCVGYSSSLTLDGIFGTKLQGSDVDIVSSHSASMSDKYGSKVKIASGRIYLLSLAGFALSTATQNSFNSKLIDLAIQTADGIINNVITNTGLNKAIYSYFNLGLEVAKDAKNLYFAKVETQKFFDDGQKAKGIFNFSKKFYAITDDCQRFAHGNHFKSYMFNNFLIIIKTITLIAKTVYSYVKKVMVNIAGGEMTDDMKLADRIFKYIIDSTELLSELNALLILTPRQENSALLVERDCIWVNSTSMKTKAQAVETAITDINLVNTVSSTLNNQNSNEEGLLARED